MTRVTNGRLKPCHLCNAPYVRPLPEGWTFTVLGVYGLYHLVTPHFPGCSRGYEKWEVPDVE